MSHFDGLLNDTLPLLQVDFTAEGALADLENPPNTGGFELVGTLVQPNAKIHMTHIWITPFNRHLHWVSEHVHDYDEVLIWTGNDPENPQDLGAELYIDIEGERRIINKSGSIYIPAGVRHCPLGFHYVNRPFLFHALSLDPEYKAKVQKS
ncbi:hypothetical protein [Mesorhizobium amorphae]|nr:hypothetical protein [Mesorhizobium amorphae]